MKNKQIVLVVDDEEKILELLRSYLSMNGLSALCAKTGQEGMALFQRNDVSLILLDLMLPDFSGETFCRQVRETSDVPIIMITAKVEEEHIIHGLGVGADDYVCKPFSPRQLMARVRAALRRTCGGAGRQLQYGGLVVDTENRNAILDGKSLTLTRDEYHILSLLMSRQAKIFTRDEILTSIKGEDTASFDRAVDTHIKNLRAKLRDDPRTPRYIVTVYGLGYRFGNTHD